MLTKIKHLSLLLIIVAILLITAQCGAAVPAAEVPAPAAEASAQAAEETKEDHAVETQENETHNNEHDMEPADLSPVDLAGGEKLKVVATTNIIGDLAHNVGGDLIELTIMLPIGADPHTFDPTPRDVAGVARAHVVLMNGLQLEEFLAELIANAGGQAPVVAVSTNVNIRKSAAAGATHADEEEHDAEVEEHDESESAHEEEQEHHDHGGVDPHVWLSPANAIVMVHNIEQALSQLDPANAAAYAANAEAYQAKLEALDEWVAAQIATIPAENRKMVTDHGAFGYYADRYGLEVVGTVLPAYSTNAEPSAQELAALQEAINDLEVKAVFVGNTVNPILAERVAEDTGIELAPLYTGSLGEAGSGAETYLDYIRYNTRAIVEGLK